MRSFQLPVQDVDVFSYGVDGLDCTVHSVSIESWGVGDTSHVHIHRHTKSTRGFVVDCVYDLCVLFVSASNKCLDVGSVYRCTGVMWRPSLESCDGRKEDGGCVLE